VLFCFECVLLLREIEVCPTFVRHPGKWDAVQMKRQIESASTRPTARMTRLPHPRHLLSRRPHGDRGVGPSIALIARGEKCPPQPGADDPAWSERYIGTELRIAMRRLPAPAPWLNAVFNFNSGST